MTGSVRLFIFCLFVFVQKALTIWVHPALLRGFKIPSFIIPQNLVEVYSVHFNNLYFTRMIHFISQKAFKREKGYFLTLGHMRTRLKNQSFENRSYSCLKLAQMTPGHTISSWLESTIVKAYSLDDPKKWLSWRQI